jgi:hypothetical protein
VKKELFLFGIISVAALIVLLFPSNSITGAVGIECPEGYFIRQGYCVENECLKVKCAKDGMLVKRPDCACMVYYGKFMCGMRRIAKTGYKTPMCTRRGQLKMLCGSYDSKLGHCIDNPKLIAKHAQEKKIIK